MNVNHGHSSAYRGGDNSRTSHVGNDRSSQQSSRQINDLLSTIDRGLSSGGNPAQAVQSLMGQLRNSGNPQLNDVAEQLEEMKSRPMADTTNPSLALLDTAKQMISGLKSDANNNGNAGHAHGGSAHRTRFDNSTNCNQSRHAISY